MNKVCYSKKVVRCTELLLLTFEHYQQIYCTYSSVNRPSQQTVQQK